MQKSGNKQLVYILAPLAMLVLSFGVVNLVSFGGNDASNGKELTATSTGPAALSAVVELETAVPPTLAASRPTNTPAPSPYPPLPPDAAIELLGPPAGSVFNLGDTITFYWNWSESLLEGEWFAIYVRIDGQERLLGTLDEPNMGRNYRWQAKIDALTDTAVPIQWAIHLESDGLSLPLVESEPRGVTILP